MKQQVARIFHLPVLHTFWLRMTDTLFRNPVVKTFSRGLLVSSAEMTWIHKLPLRVHWLLPGQHNLLYCSIKNKCVAEQHKLVDA